MGQILSWGRILTFSEYNLGASLLGGKTPHFFAAPTAPKQKIVLHTRRLRIDFCGAYGAWGWKPSEKFAPAAAEHNFPPIQGNTNIIDFTMTSVAFARRPAIGFPGVPGGLLAISGSVLRVLPGPPGFLYFRWLCRST